MLETLLLVVLAIVIGKYFGSQWYSDTTKWLRAVCVIIALLIAAALPIMFWCALSQEGLSNFSGAERWLSFLISALSFWFFMSCKSCECLHVPKKQTKSTTTNIVDNLKKVEGIGPKIEQILHDAGITSFAMLAKTNPSMIKELLAQAGDNFKYHDPTTWPVQAKMAAEDKWKQLKKRQSELKGGKA